MQSVVSENTTPKKNGFFLSPTVSTINHTPTCFGRFYNWGCNNYLLLLAIVLIAIALGFFLYIPITGIAITFAFSELIVPAICCIAFLAGALLIGLMKFFNFLILHCSSSLTTNQVVKLHQEPLGPNSSGSRQVADEVTSKLDLDPERYRYAATRIFQLIFARASKQVIQIKPYFNELFIIAENIANGTFNADATNYENMYQTYESSIIYCSNELAITQNQSEKSEIAADMIFLQSEISLVFQSINSHNDHKTLAKLLDELYRQTISIAPKCNLSQMLEEVIRRAPILVLDHLSREELKLSFNSDKPIQVYKTTPPSHSTIDTMFWFNSAVQVFCSFENTKNTNPKLYKEVSLTLIQIKEELLSENATDEKAKATGSYLANIQEYHILICQSYQTILNQKNQKMPQELEIDYKDLREALQTSLELVQQVQEYNIPDELRELMQEKSQLDQTQQENPAKDDAKYDEAKSCVNLSSSEEKLNIKNLLGFGLLDLMKFKECMTTIYKFHQKYQRNYEAEELVTALSTPSEHGLTLVGDVAESFTKIKIRKNSASLLANSLACSLASITKNDEKANDEDAFVALRHSFS